MAVGWKTEVQRSRRKTISMSVGEDGVLHIKAPLTVPVKVIEDFIWEKQSWIEKQYKRLRDRENEIEIQGYLSNEEIETLAGMAKRVLPGRVAYFAERIGVTYNRITIRKQRSRWGSCSSNGNLNFNCLLMLAPSDVADYVVVHELCHRIEMNHSRRFWSLVERELPDYAKHRKWLKENGDVLMRRMTGPE